MNVLIFCASGLIISSLSTSSPLRLVPRASVGSEVAIISIGSARSSFAGSVKRQGKSERVRIAKAGAKIYKHSGARCGGAGVSGSKRSGAPIVKRCQVNVDSKAVYIADGNTCRLKFYKTPSSVCRL